MTRSLAVAPLRAAYDVVIIGGAVIGSSVAWFLSEEPDFDGSILVVERDRTYEFTSTSRTNSCMRQQFSNPLNIKMSQFGAEFVRNFRDFMHGDPDTPELAVHHFGYLYLAATETRLSVLREAQKTQAATGAGTQLLSAEEIKHAYPFYAVDDIVGGSLNLVDEGYFDGGTMFDAIRRAALRNRVEYVENEVVAIDVAHARVNRIRLSGGQTIACGTLVNASGPRAARTAALAGLDLPVEPRKRFTFVFTCAERLDRAVPLTIDPSGIHVRTDGEAYMAGCAPNPDAPVGHDDFTLDPDIWEDRVWPTLARRIPAFERIKVHNRWAGHYAYNVLDHNAVLGPHPEIANFVFANGFSGHGLQHAPAVGRGVSELIASGSYRTLDLTPLGYHRIAAGIPFEETAVI